MRQLNTTKHNSQRLKLPFLFLLAMDSLFATSNVWAQAVVTDPAHTQLTMTGWVKELISQGKQYSQQIQQYQKQVQQYQQQIKQYQQQFVNGGKYNGSQLGAYDFEKRALNEGIAQRCPSSARVLLGPTAKTNLCPLIVQTENARFNAIVDVLIKTKQRNTELQAIYAERETINDQEAGRVQANNNRLLAFMSRMDDDMQRAKNQTDAYDRLLEALKGDQRMATQATLDGEGSGILGGVVRGAALKVALRGARRSDR